MVVVVELGPLVGVEVEVVVEDVKTMIVVEREFGYKHGFGLVFSGLLEVRSELGG